MKLRSGCIFWPEINHGVDRSFSKLDHDLNCDVAVIGGGISGALAAYYLVRAGVHAVMVDARSVARGSTAASTGLLQYEIDTPLIDLMRKLGHERAVEAYSASMDALRAFEPLVHELDDTCGLVARPSVYLAHDQNDLPALEREARARRGMGIDARFIDGDQLRREFNLPGYGAIISSDAFEIDPYRLTNQLIDGAILAGLQVFDHTEIASLESRDDHATLCTSDGFHVTANRVVVATGYETIVHLPPGLVKVKSTYALASEPVKDFSPWPQRCMIWESARPYLYVRTTEDNRVIIGGADEEIVNPKKRDALLESKADDLLERFEKLFPEINLTTDCCWAGMFAETPDGLPYIGTLPQFPHCYFALGYGGNGITFSLLAARIIRDLNLGRENRLARVFAFDR